MQSRVEALVRERFLGNVDAAAKAWGLSQPTLRRIVLGLTTRPRADVLARIARGVGTTIEWLLTGDGEAPASDVAGRPLTAAFLTWYTVVDDLFFSARNPYDPAAHVPPLELPTDDGHLTLSGGGADEALRIGLYMLPYAGYKFAQEIGLPTDATTPVGAEVRAALDGMARQWVKLVDIGRTQMGAGEMLEHLRDALYHVLTGMSGYDGRMIGVDELGQAVTAAAEEASKLPLGFAAAFNPTKEAHRHPQQSAARNAAPPRAARKEPRLRDTE